MDSTQINGFEHRDSTQFNAIQRAIFGVARLVALTPGQFSLTLPLLANGIRS
jgi:hypothetical protein